MNISRITSLLLSLLLVFICTAHADQPETPYTTAYRYTPGGLLLGVVKSDPDGVGPRKYLAVRHTYNDRNLLIRTEEGELSSWPSDESSVPADWGATFTAYKTIEYTPDSFGRTSHERLKGTQGDISLSQYSYNDDGLVKCKAVRMNISAFGQLPSSACEQGVRGSKGADRITRYTYDQSQEVLTEERGLGTPEEQTYVTNTYGGKGLLTSQTDANGNKTELRYDEANRLKRHVYPSKTRPGELEETDYTEVTYDANNNIRTERKRNGQMVTHAYDSNNRLAGKDYSSNATIQDVTYQYDLRGLQTHADFSANEGITNRYDGFGNLAATSTKLSAISRDVTFTYDLNNNRDSITYPDKTTFYYTFDGLNRVKGLSTLGKNTANLLQVTYLASGQRDSIIRPNNTKTSYLFNNGVQLSSFNQYFAVLTSDYGASFQYNPAGQIDFFTQSNNQFNFTGVSDRIGQYRIDGLNRYTSVAGVAFGYDDNNNLTLDGNYNFGYDTENRLISAQSARTNASLKYDPNGRLYQYTTNGQSREFVYAGDALIAEYNTQNALVSRYVHGDQVDEPWVEYLGSAVSTDKARYLHSNHQGSIIATSDSSGTKVAQSTYDAFGNTGPNNSGLFGYTGQVWLKELGLFYYKARMYDPTGGRFLQMDPIGYKDDMNLYSYVGGDPINRTDPTGLYTCQKGAESSCDLVDAGLKTAKAAMANMSKKDAAQVGKIIGFYGVRGQKNNVTVASGNLRGVAAQTSIENGQATITLNSKFDGQASRAEFSAGNSVAALIIHEGKHGLDGKMPSTQQESYDSEFRAYKIGAAVDKATGFVLPVNPLFKPPPSSVSERAWRGSDHTLPGGKMHSRDDSEDP